MKHYHYEIIGFSKKIHEEGTPEWAFRMEEPITITVIAGDETEAMEKAPYQIKKPFYHISKSWECHDSEVDPTLQQEMQITQMKIAAKALKLHEKS